MIHTIFTIYDAKAAAYLPPFILPRVEMARRTFSDCVNSADHQFGIHPEDYTLFRLGKFDDYKAKYELEKTPISEGNGLEFKQSELQAFAPEAEDGKSQSSPLSNDPPIQPGTSGKNSS